jgi:hypothetical protein
MRSLERTLAIEVLDPIKRMQKELTCLKEHADIILTPSEKHFVSTIEENLAYLREVVEVRRASEGVKERVLSIAKDYKPDLLPEEEEGFKW